MQNELKILNLQQEIIKELAKKGDCVMVGRTSGSILEEDYDPLKFLFTRIWHPNWTGAAAGRMRRASDRPGAGEKNPPD